MKNMKNYSHKLFIFQKENVVSRSEYIFLSPVEAMLHGTRWIPDRTSDKTFFFCMKKKKKVEHQEFVWLLKQFGATVPWQILNLGEHMSISSQ